jgi:hypothetical protein
MLGRRRGNTDERKWKGRALPINSCTMMAAGIFPRVRFCGREVQCRLSAEVTKAMAEGVV